MHVASVYFKYFKFFRGMFQVFHTDVAKIDRDVAHVAIVVHICCKCLFLMFHLFFYTYVASLSGCCIYFTHILQVFYLDVAYVCNGFQLFL